MTLVNDFRPPRARTQALLARVADLAEGDRAEVTGLAAVSNAVTQDEFDRVTRTVTPLEEIAGLILELRWRELVDMGEALEKTEGSDFAAKLWAYAHKTRSGDQG